jgi:molybdate transport system substrate-binding protein
MIATFLLLAIGAQATDLHVAAAANLASVLPELSAAFEKATHIHIVRSMGATAQLTQQIENGAPFDVFLAADVEHIDRLIKGRFILPGSRAIYARGQLVVWAPRRPDIRSLKDLTKSDVHAIGVAKPELAPYGVAAIDSMKNAGLWNKLQPKIVYAPSIAVAKQFADTGNTEASFTALALTAGQRVAPVRVDENLHKPIEQALGIVAASKEQKKARAFTAFLASPAAREILRDFGYVQP